MRATRYTPGPWALDGTTIIQPGEGGQEIAEILTDEVDELGQATGTGFWDGLLIMGAPELVEAAHDALVTLLCINDPSLNEVRGRLQKAIDKALGD